MNLKIAREEKCLTQTQVGAFINRSAAYISLVENGKAELSDAQIIILASSLGVREKWLRGEDMDMTDHESSRDRRTIGERIIEIRKKEQLTQSAIAGKLRVSRNTISLLERNKINASSAIIRALVENMEIDETWLRTGVHISRTEEIKEWLKAHPGDLKEIREWLNSDIFDDCGRGTVQG